VESTKGDAPHDPARSIERFVVGGPRLAGKLVRGRAVKTGPEAVGSESARARLHNMSIPGVHQIIVDRPQRTDSLFVS
jgi:hypothetical protein